MEQREKVFTFNFSLLIFAALSLFTIFQGLMFFMPIYMMSFGVGEAGIGLAAGIFMLIAIFSRPFTAPYADKHGCRGIMMVSLVLFGLGTFCYIWARSAAVIFLLRALQGVAWGTLVAGAFTLAAKLAPRTRQAEALGYFSMVTALGGSIGPALIEAVYRHYTYSNALGVFGGLSFLCLFSLLFLKEPSSDVQSPAPGIKPSFITLSVIVPSLIGMFIMFCYGTVVTFLPVLGQTRGMANVGIFFTVSGAVSVVGRLLSGKYVDRYGHFPLISLSTIFFFLAMLVIALAPNLAFLLVGAILVGLGLSLTTPALMSLVVALASKAERGRAMSTFTGFYDLGIGTGSIGIGFLLSVTSITTVYLTCAGIMLMNLFFVLYQGRLHLKKVTLERE